jgi:DNA repair exonuclease SbcCD ATPase subunit
MTFPSTMPTPSNVLLDSGVKDLEALAKEKKRKLKIERAQFFESGQRQARLSDELEEIEKKISDFDGGTCPTCNQAAPKMFDALKAKRAEIEIAYGKAHEEVIEISNKCQEIEREVNDLETQIHQVLRKSRGQI